MVLQRAAHTAEVKGQENWVKATGEFLTFPGGDTQFILGALHYIDFIQEAEASIAWGKRTRVVLAVIYLREMLLQCLLGQKMNT